MQLSIRPKVYSLPPYSLTGDLLGFIRCGLQYRYTRIGQLPASRPVQMWFGQFIHGILEESFRRFDEERKKGTINLPPWPDSELDDICDLIQKRLAAQGLFPWTLELEKQGRARAKTAINELGPELFPLIHRAEVRLTGARALPLAKIPVPYQFREADRYEMVGVIDVITHVQLSDPLLKKNKLVKKIVAALPKHPPDKFEIIIDYKGMRRSTISGKGGTGPNYWKIYDWQVQTYAHLRRSHEDSLPVVAGIILYVNELHPTRRDLTELKKEISSKLTDVVPDSGSKIEDILDKWKRRDPVPSLPFDFRLDRALKVVTISDASIDTALNKFDNIVATIEICRGKELQHGRVLSSWDKNATDGGTCASCDSRTFCPDYTKENSPKLPAVKI
ncbi:PD-(D/E)XK nuclease family protein [Thermodesulfobacteriota bacterium]